MEDGQIIAVRSGLTIQRNWVDDINLHGIDDEGRVFNLSINYTHFPIILEAINGVQKSREEKLAHDRKVYCYHPNIEDGRCLECGAKEDEIEKLQEEMYNRCHSNF